MSALRFLVVKDLQILRRSPLLVVLLALYAIVIGLPVGYAVSRPPSKPKVAFLNEVTPGGGTFSVDGSDDVVTIFATDRSPALGTYAYDLSTDRFLRISHGMSMFSMGGPTPAGELMWSTAVNDNHGATQWLGELTP